MVLRNIFGRERDDVTGEWRRLYNEEQLISAGRVVGMVKRRVACRVLLGKLEEEGLRGRSRRR
jgi:hypothetical protein